MENILKCTMLHDALVEHTIKHILISIGLSQAFFWWLFFDWFNQSENDHHQKARDRLSNHHLCLTQHSFSR